MAGTIGGGSPGACRLNFTDEEENTVSNETESCKANKTSTSRAAAIVENEPVDVLAWITATWPHLEGVPLAIGIRQQLQPHLPDSISDQQLRQALERYTGQDRYLILVAAKNSQRVDLAGNRQPVSDEHQQHARVRLQQRQAAHLAKKAVKSSMVEATTASAQSSVPAALPRTVDKRRQPVLSLKRHTSVESA